MIKTLAFVTLAFAAVTVSLNAEARSTIAGAAIYAQDQHKASYAYIKSQLELGHMYFSGYGVKQDYAKAKSKFEIAAAGGDPEAMYMLGVMYYMGEGSDQDQEQAKLLFEMAAERNFPDALAALGVIYENGEGVEQDLVTARKWYGKACSAGMEDSCAAGDRLSSAQ